MSKQEIKNLYNTMLNSGDLFEVYPGLSGDWKLDKDKFIEQYNLNQEFILDDDFSDLFLSKEEDDYLED
jgi:hypothetical protein